MNLEYKINLPISADQFIELLRESTLGERRPIEDHECIEGMVFLRVVHFTKVTLIHYQIRVTLTSQQAF